MVPIKPIAFVATAMGAGAALALGALVTDVLTGWIGALALVGWAVAARQRWARRERESLEPGAPERILWLRLSGAALILGHAATALILVGDDLRLGHGNILAIDSWTMIAALPVAAMVFRRDAGRHDERHAVIAARGVRAGYATLAATLVFLLGYLAFTPTGARSLLTHFVLANLLVVLLLASYLVMLLTELAAYARDTRPVPHDE